MHLLEIKPLLLSGLWRCGREARECGQAVDNAPPHTRAMPHRLARCPRAVHTARRGRAGPRRGFVHNSTGHRAQISTNAYNRNENPLISTHKFFGRANHYRRSIFGVETSIWCEYAKPLQLKNRRFRDAILSDTTLCKVGFENVDLHCAKLRRSDLQGANLQGAKFQYTDLRGANLQEANLKKAKLHGAALSGAKLHDADLTRAELQCIVKQGSEHCCTDPQDGVFCCDLSEAELNRAILRNAKLQDTNLSKTKLYRAILEGAELQRVNLQDADLRLALLWGAKLHGANLRGAELHHADLSGAKLHGAYMSGAKLHDAYMSQADLSKAKLHNADLQGAELHGADLQEAELHGANLWGAELHGANLSGARLHGANLSGAELHGANLSGAEFHGANLQQAKLPGAQFTRTKLDLADLREIDLSSRPNGEAVRIEEAVRIIEEISDSEVRKKALERLRRSEGDTSVEPGSINGAVLCEEDALYAGLKRFFGPKLPGDTLYVVQCEANNKSNEYVGKLADELVNLACSDKSGYVAKGIAYRAISDWVLGPPLSRKLLSTPRCQGVTRGLERLPEKERDDLDRIAARGGIGASDP